MTEAPHDGSGGPLKSDKSDALSKDSEFRTRARKLRIIASFQLVFLSFLLTIFGTIAIYAPEILELQSFYKATQAEALIEQWEARVEGMDVDLRGIAVDPKTGDVVAVGDNGFVGTSDERALVWTERQGNTRKAFNGVAWSVGGETVIAAGDDGLIRVSEDGGATWSNPGNLTKKDINGVALSADGRTAIVVGDDGLIRVSVDGGANWRRPDNVTPEDITGVALSRNGRVAVFVGDNGLIRVARVDDHQKLIERGVWEEGIWEGEHPKERHRDFEAVAISADGGTAIAVGRNGLIMHSRDTGRNWNLMVSNVADDLNAVALSDDGGTAFAVGYDGTVLISTSSDSDATWRGLDSKTPHRLEAVAFGDGGRIAIIVGGNVVLRSTSPAGKFFSEIETPRTPAIERLGTGESALSLEADVSSETEAESESKPRLGQWYIFSGIQAVRVLIIFLLLYFTQNLVASMRYNRRLATHYDACADAMRLFGWEALSRPGEGDVSSWQKRIDLLEQLMNAVSPDHIDIGRSPRSVVEHATRRARAMLRRGKKD